MAFVIALVTKDGDFGNGNGDLLGRNGGAGTKKVVENAMDIVEVLPDKAADLGVSRNSLILSILSFVAGSRSLDAGIVCKGLSRVWDLRFKNEDDVSMKNQHGTGPSLGQTG